MALSPRHKGPAGEFRAVVVPHGQWVATEQRSSIQDAGHVLARDAPPFTAFSTHSWLNSSAIVRNSMRRPLASQSLMKSMRQTS